VFHTLKQFRNKIVTALRQRVERGNGKWLPLQWWVSVPELEDWKASETPWFLNTFIWNACDFPKRIIFYKAADSIQISALQLGLIEEKLFQVFFTMPFFPELTLLSSIWLNPENLFPLVVLLNFHLMPSVITWPCRMSHYKKLMEISCPRELLKLIFTLFLFFSEF
jgi:hypothetical protein